ncbi:uncharacterized protein [Haliotis asinina]|uniref:uncharacterized protein n=1 Tax=Haliotis asinina TaxID=109174 RepID=UPI0035318422
MAQNRLIHTEKKLNKDEAIAEAYSDVIQQYEAKGYIRKVSEKEKAETQWRHWTTKLIVKHHHEKNRHLGTNGTLAALSSRFWIISAREEIREWERQCAWCKRRKPKQSTQIMADLPKVRVRSSKAFEQVAVDFAGPFITIQGRGKRRTKRYLCLFTCLTTRAAHLEIAFGLDADSFLNAFFRMTSRRGIPKEVLSDNGTNFIKASKELKELVQSNLDSDKVKGSLANKGIIWRFNPPSAPHFGGVYESLIKSAKRAICGILANGDLSDEELMTAFIGAEELLNSRPLTYQSSHPDDNIPLTPSHFLHGMLGGSLAPDIDCSPYNPKKRWRRIQELLRHFWRRWMREWLPTLNLRRKWCESSRDYQCNLHVLKSYPGGHLWQATYSWRMLGNAKCSPIHRVDLGAYFVHQPVCRHTKELNFLTFPRKITN